MTIALVLAGWMCVASLCLSSKSFTEGMYSQMYLRAWLLTSFGIVIELIKMWR